MKNLILIIVIWLICFGCKKACKDEDYYLTETEKAWLPYGNGQVLIFKSNAGLYDTCTVSASFNWDSGYPQGGECNIRYEQGTNMFAHPVSGGGFYININRYKDFLSGGITSPRILIAGSGGGTGAGYYLNNYPVQNNVNINGNLFNQVIIVTQDTSFFGSDPAV